MSGVLTCSLSWKEIHREVACGRKLMPIESVLRQPSLVLKKYKEKGVPLNRNIKIQRGYMNIQNGTPSYRSHLSASGSFDLFNEMKDAISWDMT